MTDAVSYGRQLSLLAQQRGDQTAIVFVDHAGGEVELSWRELDQRANQVARLLRGRGVQQGDIVVVALENSPQHFITDFAAWRLGATVLPLRWDLPQWERDRLLGLANPAMIVANWPDAPVGTLSPADLDAAEDLDAGPLPDAVPNPVRAIATSGSTGGAKLIIAPVAGIVGGDAMATWSNVHEERSRTTELVISPMYHTNGFACFNGLLEGQRLVVMRRFDPALTVDLIERHRVNSAIMVPTMLRRIAELPDISDRDFSSIDVIHYGGAPIPEWVARAWFALVGPERFVFSYGGTEAIGLTMARGDEWLQHQGTVGKPVGCDVKILGEAGQQLEPGQVGAICMRRTDGAPASTYVGAENLWVDEDGYSTLGDLGYLDTEGYLYLVDRRVDIIITGGANVYPAEVELVLAEHPGVADTVVVGLPDDEWGRRVHAIVQPKDPNTPPTADELQAHVRSKLAAYKVPKTIELIERVPRTDAGKINRAALAAERST